jgi:hypothetical protein
MKARERKPRRGRPARFDRRPVWGAKHPKSRGQKNFAEPLEARFPQNNSSIVEAKRLGKHDDNSVRIHVASRRMWL